MRSLLLATAAAVFLPQAAHASPDDDGPDPLDEVVVTATRLPAIVADTPGARVIDRETIDRRGAVFAADILSDVPGLSVVRSGAFGGVAQVRMRGASPGKTLVLIDGVPVNDPAEVNGAFDFSGLELSDIERIEVLSGPQSSLWGSDAIGGVIAFTTRELDGLALEAEAGSFDTVRGRLAAGVAFVLGAEREETEGSLSTGLSERLGTTSAFATARIDPAARLSLTGALRFDDTDDFGAKTTGRLSAALDAGAGVTLSAAWGTGFKAPSISQAVCDFCFSSQPFPVLRPETATGYEAAVGWASADGRIEGRATAYRLEVEDQITYVFDPATFDSHYVNVAETATDGVELEGRARLGGGFDLGLAWAWTDARDETTGARLLRVPEQAGSATLGWSGERLSAALTVRGESDQDDAGGVREAFVTASLNGSYALSDRVELTARIENLANARYQQVFGYGEPGRSASVGIRLRY